MLPVHETDLQVLQNVDVLPLFIEQSYFSYLISYTNGMIIVQNEWHIFIPSSCTPCCGYVPDTIF